MTEERPPIAWQPLTPGGVAAFARASWGRLLVVQLVVALLAAGSVVWFLRAAWFPVIDDAIRRLPEQGEIRLGKLDWRGDSPTLLAGGRFLALAVDLDHGGQARSPAHLQVEFGRGDVQIFSLFGFVQEPYPRGWTLGFNHAELAPWWGAWAPAILAIALGLVLAGLMLIWMLLAALYSLPAWLAGFFANRTLRLGGSWRLAGASLMPGALFLTAAIVLYGLGALDLLRLGVAAAAHVVIGWGYLCASLLALPRCPVAVDVKSNPFIAPGSEPVKNGGAERKSKEE
jgi:hypothetical protein